MNYLNKLGKQIHDTEYARCLRMAQKHNENVVAIFNDWWYGKCVSTDEYKLNYSEEDHDNAGSIILETISRGFG